MSLRERDPFFHLLLLPSQAHPPAVPEAVGRSGPQKAADLGCGNLRSVQ